MRKTAVCGRVHAAHDNRCLPGEGRQLKAGHSVAVGAWADALTRVTPAREKPPAPPLVPARQFQRLHPAAYRAGSLLFRVQRSPNDRLTTLRL